jgi:hypothetical protein
MVLKRIDTTKLHGYKKSIDMNIWTLLLLVKFGPKYAINFDITTLKVSKNSSLRWPPRAELARCWKRKTLSKYLPSKINVCPSLFQSRRYLNAEA